MSRDRRRRHRQTEREDKESVAFSRYTRWIPEDLPPTAVPHWPRKEAWPSAADIRQLVDSTESDLDARLAVLTGLRRWAEPGSSQMLVSLGTIIIAIVAIAVGVSDFDPIVFTLIVVIGILYISVALFGFGQAMQIDERRKMAHSWLRAIEDELDNRKSATKGDYPSPRRSWFRALRPKPREGNIAVGLQE